MNASDPDNRHGCVVAIAGRGVLIEGPSGAGKTSLALGLVDTALARGLDAALVADDRALLRKRGDAVIAEAPAAIAGLAEIRGYGVARVATRASAAIGLVARLVDDEAVERMPEPAFADLLGARLPLLFLPCRHETQGVRIVLAFLAEMPAEAGGRDPRFRLRDGAFRPL